MSTTNVPVTVIDNWQSTGARCEWRWCPHCQTYTWQSARLSRILILASARYLYWRVCSVCGQGKESE